MPIANIVIRLLTEVAATSLLHPQTHPEETAIFRALIEDADTYMGLGFNSLHRIICGLSHLDLAEEIRQHPEIVHERDRAGGTPLFCSACRGDISSVSLLISHGAEVNIPDRDNCASIEFACLGKSAECVQLLINAGADLNAVYPQDGYDSPCLVQAVTVGSTYLTTLLLQSRADLDLEKWPAAIQTATGGHTDIMRILSDFGANLDTRVF
jgi:hypothetical protein